MRPLHSIRAMAIFLLCAVSLRVSADEVDRWFDTDTRASSYEAIRGGLVILAQALDRSGIPVDLLVDRLDEGSAKKVNAPKLLEALRKDCDDFLFLGDLYSYRYPVLFADESVKRVPLVVGSLILRSGIDRDDLEKCLPDNGTDVHDVQRSLDALLAVALVHRRSPLGPGQLLRLTQGLASSSEKSDRFPALSSLFVRGRAGGIRESDIAELVIGTLGRGGGFVQAENEISRRIR